MDGNGRWAKQRGLPRIKGHEEGAESVSTVMTACRKMGVKYITLYAFSTENWNRPKAEVDALMELLASFLDNRKHELHDNKVRLHVTGRIKDLSRNLQNKLAEVMAETEKYDEAHLVLALSYSGREEIVHAARTIAEKAARGEIDPKNLDEKMFASHLYLPDIPDPDLLIRTSGEMRVSNFLLWQISYSELYITDVLWPDFREEELAKAIEEYGLRERRFGKI